MTETTRRTDDPDALRRWLDETRGLRVRLPVVVWFSSASRVIQRGALVWTGAAMDIPPDKLADHARFSITLETTALGIDLPTRLRTLDGHATPWCAVWLDGTWGALLPGPFATPNTLSVRAVHGPITPEDAPLAHLLDR